MLPEASSNIEFVGIFDKGGRANRSDELSDYQINTVQVEPSLNPYVAEIFLSFSSNESRSSHFYSSSCLSGFEGDYFWACQT